MATYLAGIDIGTSGAKGMVFDLQGNVLGTGYREYPCSYPRPGWVEQDADLLVDSAMRAMSEAVEQQRRRTGVHRVALPLRPTFLRNLPRRIRNATSDR